MRCANCPAQAPPGRSCCLSCEAKAANKTANIGSGKASPAETRKTSPEFDRLYGNLGDDEMMLEAARTLSQQGQTKRAIGFYEEACRRMPDLAAAHSELAVLLLAAAMNAWLPWEKKRFAREAGLAAGRAINLDANNQKHNGDNWFIAAEAAEIAGTDANNILSVRQQAFDLYQRQIQQGEQVSGLYLVTAIRLGRMKEAMGDRAAAATFYSIMARATELERAGIVRPGGATPDQIADAQANMARLQRA